MRLLCLVAIVGSRAVLGAPNLASDNLRFGGESVADSIGMFGNLDQPWYRSGSAWNKLSYSDFAVDFKASAGGATLSCSDNKDCNAYTSGFTTDTTGLTGTVGTITVTSTVGDMTLERAYTISSTSAKLMTCNVKMTNNGVSPIADGEAWFGTRDDFVGNSDSPQKRTGALSDGAFVYSSTGGNTIEVKSGSEVVYLTSPSDGSVGIISATYSLKTFKKVWIRTTSAVTDQTNDAGYGMYLSYGTIGAGDSVERTVIYAAGGIESISEIAAAAASASRMPSPPPEPPPAPRVLGYVCLSRACLLYA